MFHFELPPFQAKNTEDEAARLALEEQLAAKQAAIAAMEESEAAKQAEIARIKQEVLDLFSRYFTKCYYNIQTYVVHNKVFIAAFIYQPIYQLTLILISNPYFLGRRG